MAQPTWWIWVRASSGSLLKDREAWHAAVHGITKSQTWLGDGTTATVSCFMEWIQCNINRRVISEATMMTGLRRQGSQILQIWLKSVKGTNQVITFPNLATLSCGHFTQSGRSAYSGLLVEHTLVQLCLTVRNPMDCSPPGSSVHGILQARIQEGVAILSSKGPSWPRDQIHAPRVPCIGRWILYHCIP